MAASTARNIRVVPLHLNNMISSGIMPDVDIGALGNDAYPKQLIVLAVGTCESNATLEYGVVYGWSEEDVNDSLRTALISIVPRDNVKNLKTQQPTHVVVMGSGLEKARLPAGDARGYLLVGQGFPLKAGVSLFNSFMVTCCGCHQLCDFNVYGCESGADHVHCPVVHGVSSDGGFVGVSSQYCMSNGSGFRYSKDSDQFSLEPTGRDERNSTSGVIGAGGGEECSTATLSRDSVSILVGLDDYYCAGGWDQTRPHHMFSRPLLEGSRRRRYVVTLLRILSLTVLVLCVMMLLGGASNECRILQQLPWATGHVANRVDQVDYYAGIKHACAVSSHGVSELITLSESSVKYSCALYGPIAEVCSFSLMICCVLGGVAAAMGADGWRSLHKKSSALCIIGMGLDMTAISVFQSECVATSLVGGQEVELHPSVGLLMGCVIAPLLFINACIFFSGIINDRDAIAETETGEGRSLLSTPLLADDITSCRDEGETRYWE